ncbi:MAG: DUF3261 domain-containing protein [Deltaproteobacteria bacterium]|nr:DUF3261 domain-containing protein [Deltaproteobacteria bacterium]
MKGFSRSSGWRAGAVVLPLVGTLACATLLGWRPTQGCPVVPVSSAELPEHATLRARMRIRSGDAEVGLEVVARAQSGELVVVGLAPYGPRLFTVHQREREYDVETVGSSARLRVLAHWVMDALHRAYWIGPASSDPGGASQPRFVWAGERVLESEHDGQRRRVFLRAGSDSAAPGVTIDYSRPPASGRAVIHNRWCGYEAVVAILDEQTERGRQEHLDDLDDLDD